MDEAAIEKKRRVPCFLGRNTLMSLTAGEPTESTVNFITCCESAFAACGLLTADEAYSFRALEAVVKRGGLDGLTAEITLGEWKRGNLPEFRE